MTTDFWYEDAGENGDITRVVIAGDMNNEGCQYLLECVEHQIKGGVAKVIIDCTEMEYISSMGLGTLVRAHSRMKKKGGEVKLAGVQGVIASVLTAVHLDRVFQMYPTLEEAIASFDAE